MEPDSIQNKISSSTAIIIAGVIIAGAIFLSNGSQTGNPVVAQPQDAQQQTGNLEAMQPITSADHIRGNPDAPVKIEALVNLFTQAFAPAAELEGRNCSAANEKKFLRSLMKLRKRD